MGRKAGGCTHALCNRSRPPAVDTVWSNSFHFQVAWCPSIAPPLAAAATPLLALSSVLAKHTQLSCMACARWRCHMLAALAINIVSSVEGSVRAAASAGHIAPEPRPAAVRVVGQAADGTKPTQLYNW
jgi:hypothetical protein